MAESQRCGRAGQNKWICGVEYCGTYKTGMLVCTNFHAGSVLPGWKGFLVILRDGSRNATSTGMPLLPRPDNKNLTFSQAIPPESKQISRRMIGGDSMLKGAKHLSTIDNEQHRKLAE